MSTSLPTTPRPSEPFAAALRALWRHHSLTGDVAAELLGIHPDDARQVLAHPEHADVGELHVLVTHCGTRLSVVAREAGL